MIIKNSKTPVRKFTHDGKVFNLTLGSEVVSLHKKFRSIFKDITRNVDVLDEVLTSTDDRVIHSKIGNFYLNKDLVKYLDGELSWNTVSEINMLIKSACYDNSSDCDSTGIFNYIYHPDKYQYLYARIKHGIAQEDSIDRLSRHRCGKEEKSKNFIYRHFGTAEGHSLFRQTIFEENLKLLRYIFNGSPDIPFRCASSGIDLENTGYLGFPEELKINSSKIPLHHVLVVNNASLRKTRKENNGKNVIVDPSRILVSKFLELPENKDFLIDLLGCIPLSSDQHGYCHSLRSSDITFHKNLKFMPKHISSKEHFEEISKKYNLGLNYEEFYYSMTFESVGEDNNEILDSMIRYVKTRNTSA